MDNIIKENNINIKWGKRKALDFNFPPKGNARGTKKEI
jgi:hypothetical protein